MNYSISFLIAVFITSTAAAQFITNNGIRIDNSSVLTTNGDWVTDAGAAIVNNGAIETSGSFVNHGTLDAGSTGGFVLDYAADLSFQTGGAQVGFLTKVGTGAALVTGTIAVKDSLVLKNGALRLVNATDTVSMLPGAVLSATQTAFVEGLMARTGSGDIMFPVGRDGHYLPVTLHKVEAQKVTAEVRNAPSGYTAGPGLDSLINFPYVWSVQEKADSDTAAYVEVNYPDTLPVGANPIIAREVPGQQYASMGARFTSNTAGRVTVRSYSRRLKGLYTIANGFPADLETDSLALVALYNETAGQNWANSSNWLAEDIGTWFGVTLTGQSITALDLGANNLAGIVPELLVDIQALQTVDLSGNQISSIPDFSRSTELTSLNVSNNRLNFGALEPNASVPGLEYANQAEVGEPVDALVPVGTPYEFTADAGGASSEYLWKRNGAIIEGASGPVYSLAAINRSNMGDYVSEVTNPFLPDLKLTTAMHRALAYANVSGQLMADESTPAKNGTVTLLKITTAAYDTIGPVEVSSDGTFDFEKTVLADYQLVGFADTTDHEGSLPTYYVNTLFWEEADTIALEGDVSELTIVSLQEPQPTSGEGSIDGTLEEDDGTGGRTDGTEKTKRVKGAGVSARRVESSGRGKEEILTLVAYVFTNDLGEFKIPDLPPGVYRLNMQYPGYPMDETSFTTITIGTALESQVTVAATVTEGKINVRKLIITGIAGEENHGIHLYPNPAKDNIRMNFAGVADRRVIIHDTSGKVLKSATAQEKELYLDIRDLGPGLYILRIVEKGALVRTLKLSIE